MTLIFETHATSLDNEAGLASGWYDVDLSPAGERQARELGERHRDEPIDAVYCSDLVRSSRTAEIAFGSRPEVPIHVDARLRECDYGDLTRAAASQIESLRVESLARPFPNGESYEQAVARIRTWLKDASRARHESPIVVIGHRVTYYAFEHLVRGTPLRDVLMAPWKWQPGWRYELN